MSRRPTPDVALVHDYFVQDGGAERVAIELARMFPDAPVHTTFFESAVFGNRIDPSRVRSWPLAGIEPTGVRFRALLPAYVAYYSALTVRANRLVISNSSTFSRAVRVRRPATHVAYVHSPLRFAWDVDGYLARSSFPAVARGALRIAAPALRGWDRWAGRRADAVVANSTHMRDRIRDVWDRDCAVIHPPVDVAGASLSTAAEDFYLVTTRLLAYKRVDVAVRACAALDRALVVVGDGPERARLQRIAGARTRFVGHVPQAQLEDLQRRCRALIVPGVEDFGMAAVEAMAIGKPVVGLGAGGTLETVVDGETGVHFPRPTARDLADGIERLESLQLSPAAARERAMTFDVSVFHARWSELLSRLGLGDLLPATTAPTAPPSRPV